jgi:hypothetical protein
MGWCSDHLPTIDDITSGLRFLWRLPGVLRYPIDSKQTHAELEDRLTHRAENFLILAREAVYDNSSSVYRQLLRWAGCEYPDLEHLVRRDGLEGALHQLYRRGVYLTVDELKGKRPVVRGSATLQVTSEQLRDPRASVDMVAQSSGSRGPRRAVPIDLDLVRENAAEEFLNFEARDGLNCVRGIWTVPGNVALMRIIRYILCGAPPSRWFFLVDPRTPGLHPRYLWSARALRWVGYLVGVRLPAPIPVPLQDPLPIVRWLAEVLENGKVPDLYSYASCVVRVCQAALDAGIDLTGSRFMLGGEATTTARLAVIRKAGGEPQVYCGSVETGGIGRGCMAPEASDEVHFFHHRYALIQPGESGTSGLPPQALLLSSLLLGGRCVLLNVSMGDQAVVSLRNCGCPLEKVGWTTHLHTIRSFEKLTAGGMTLLDADIVRVLEEVLPAQFGGVPTDYQLVDESINASLPSVRLLVHPRLGSLDHEAVRQAFLNAIGHGSGAERLAGLTWQDAGLPIVEREAPRITGGGKIQHVHLDSGGSDRSKAAQRQAANGSL